MLGKQMHRIGNFKWCNQKKEIAHWFFHYYYYDYDYVCTKFYFLFLFTTGFIRLFLYWFTKQMEKRKKNL